MNTLLTNGLENALFKKNEKLINSRCRVFANKTGLPLEEVLSEGYLIFVKATKKYDINRNTKFSTFLYTQLLSLSDYYLFLKAKRRRFILNTISLDGRDTQVPYTTPKGIDRTTYHLLSTGAKEIIDGLLSGAFDIINPKKKRLPGKQRIEKILKEKGWSRKQVHNTWREITDWVQLSI